jgi:hypothetical protein
MRHDSDSDSERSSDHHGGASAPAPEQRAGPAPGIPPANNGAAVYPPQGDGAAARVLDQYRAEALMNIDKAGFSCVAGQSRHVSCLLIVFHSLFHLKVCLVVGIGFFTDAWVLIAYVLYLV